MKKHPSGRPVRAVESRDYSMMANWGKGYRLPRLNHDRPPHDTSAIGFITLPEPEHDYWHVTEARRK